MKHLVTLLALFTLIFQTISAQTPHAQNARDHFPVSPDLRNGEVLTFLTFTMVINGEFVTRINGSGTADWSRTYFVNGQGFRPWGAIEIGNQIAMMGNLTSGGHENFVVMIDYNGQPQWAREYSLDIHQMTKSINGNLLLASTDLGDNYLEYILVEVDPYNGSIIQHERTGIPDFPNSYGNIKDIEHNGVWYLAILEAGGVTLSITSDANLHTDQVHRHESNQLNQVDIREIRRSIQGDFYVTGVDPSNDQYFCGKMSINQWFTDLRRVKLAQGNYSLDMAQGGPVSVESPNRVPYYHGGSWGSITVIPGNAAFSFVGTARDANTGLTQAVLIQYDEYWNLNYSKLYDYGSSIGEPNIVKRYNEQLIMVTPQTISGNIRLTENRLADDLIGCFSSHVSIEERELEITNSQISHTREEDEVSSEQKDPNHSGNFVISSAGCPPNKANVTEHSLEGDFQLRAFPNPSSGPFTLEGVAGTDIDIYSLQGKKVRSIPASPSMQVKISGLTRGTYLVRSRRLDNSRALKITVQ